MREQARRDAAATHDHQEVATHEEPEKKDHFVGGHAPPVQQGFGDQGGTAQLAFEEDENEKELKAKVGALVNKKFGGDFQKAFAHYDKDGDGAVGKSELVELLSDAGVGNGLTRGIWASKIIDKLDSSSDKKIQWLEFESVFKATA